MNLTQIFGLIQITLVGVTLAVISATIEFLIYTLESSRKQKIGFCQAFIHEIKRSFSKNKKKVKNSDLITRPILEQSTTSEAMELS